MKQALTYGLITGLVITIYFALLYAGGVDMMSNTWLALLSYPILFFLVFYFAIRIRKQDFGGYWDFMAAFRTLFIIFSVSAAVTTVWGILLYTVIDKEIAGVLVDKITEKTILMMEDWGAPQEQIDETMAEFAKMPEQFTTSGMLLGFLKQLIWFAIVAAVGALIIRKSRPAFAEEVIDKP